MIYPKFEKGSLLAWDEGYMTYFIIMSLDIPSQEHFYNLVTSTRRGQVVDPDLAYRFDDGDYFLTDIFV